MIEDSDDPEQEELTRLAANMILSAMYQLKQQGTTEISEGDLLVLMGYDLDDIEEARFNVILSLPDSADEVAALSHARLNNQIH